MSLEIQGKIKIIKPLETFSSGSVKQQIVVTTNDQYPQDLAIDFFKDKTDYLQSFNEGDDVTVSTNLRGSSYQDKHYVSLTAWRIIKTPFQ